MNTESKWNDDQPDWVDIDKRAEVQREDGSIIVGKLVTTDYWVAGDDEIPVWGIELEDGTLVDWHSAMKWRYKT